MPADKFGRNGYRTIAVYTRTNIANLTNSIYLYMNCHIVKNVADPLSNQDVQTRII